MWNPATVLTVVAVLALLGATHAFVPTKPVAAPLVRAAPVRMGFFDEIFGGKPDPEKEYWKEQAYLEQQKILAERRKTGGFISKEAEEEIAQRRASVGEESRLLKEVQQGGGGDRLEDWKKLRESGKIRTANKGLTRDKGSERLGSSGLFEVRTDERLPYIDQGYVPDAEEKEDLGSKLKGFFDGLGKK